MNETKEELIQRLKEDILAFGEDHLVYPYFLYQNEAGMVLKDYRLEPWKRAADFETLGGLLEIAESDMTPSGEETEMEVKIVGITQSPMGDWLDGVVGSYKFQAKGSMDPTPYGIRKGRILKLMIWPEDRNCGSNIAHYDRGWGRRPKTINEAKILEAVIKYLEGLSKGIFCARQGNRR